MQGTRHWIRSRRLRAALLLPLLAVPLACCTGATASSEPYVIGATVDLSGPLAAYGKGFTAAWNGYFSAVNAGGGIDGHHVKLVVLDDASDPARASANVRELLAEKALLVSGITVSDTCALLAPILSKAKVPELCTTIPSSLVVTPPPYVYSMTDPETMWVSAISSVIASQVHTPMPRVATILPDVGGLQDLEAAFDAAAAARSWTDVADPTVPLSNLSDVAGPVATVLAAKPDAVMTEIAAVGADPMVQGLRAGGFDGPVVMANAEYSTLQTLQDPSLFQVWPTQVVDPQSPSPAVQAMTQQLAAQGVHGTTSINSDAIPVDYLGAALVAKALSSCGSQCNSRVLNTAMQSTTLSLDGITVGQFGYSPGSNVPENAVDVYRWDASRNGPLLAWANVPAVQPLPTP